MTDCMNFPKSFNEFIDDYSFNDLDEIYTNGSKLIPTFRVMQGYEHFEKMIRANERAKVIDEVKQYLLKHAKTVREIETKHIYDAVKAEWIIDLKESEQNG